jgi:UDP-glucose 6-dehydrogenase
MFSMKDLTIGIIGGGVVGKATARTYLEYVKEVRVYDVVKEKSTVPYLSEAVEPADLIFVCIPEDNIDEMFRCIPKSCTSHNFVIKSTVPIGTTRRLQQQYELNNIVHSPEFLTARIANTDALLPSRNIIGYPSYEQRETAAGGLLWRLYTYRFPGTVILEITSEESEAIKLFTNGFFATKISYFNEIKTYSDKLGLDWTVILAGMLSDGRIAHSHTQVPGSDGKAGWEGACFPKDMRQLIRQMGNNAIVTKAAYDRNFQVDRKEPVKGLSFEEQRKETK